MKTASYNITLACLKCKVLNSYWCRKPYSVLRKRNRYKKDKCKKYLLPKYVLVFPPYLLFLANPVSSVHGLKVHLRVPVRVKEDNYVCSVQVDTETSSPVQLRN